MQLFGLTITRQKDVSALSPLSSRGGWWPVIREPFTGAWQQNKEIRPDSVLAYHAVYACITLIAADIGKLRTKLVQKDENDIWSETFSPAFSPVLRKPNRFQNHIQFKEWWMVSKLVRGNTYVLLQRDLRGIVVAMYLLDPSRVTTLVASDGSVYYDLGEDNLSGVGAGNVRVPASEILHDRMNCMFHPLVGTSPIFACGTAGAAGLAIQDNSNRFFGNNSTPGGVLTAPEAISDETAGRLKAHWEANYTGANSGRIAVLGDGLKFEPMRMTAVDSQLIEQLRWTAEVVCSCFHVPAYMVGVGQPPSYNNIEALAQQYYTQCLQSHIESIELCIDEGLGLDSPKDGKFMGVELDLDGLLRMDTSTQVKTLTDAINGSVMAPNEGRKRLNLPPLAGGDSIYMQQQNYSLEALAKRDAGEDPFGRPEPAAAPEPAAPAIEPTVVSAPKDFEGILHRALAATEDRRQASIEAERTRNLEQAAAERAKLEAEHAESQAQLAAQVAEVETKRAQEAADLAEERARAASQLIEHLESAEENKAAAAEMHQLLSILTMRVDAEGVCV